MYHKQTDLYVSLCTDNKLTIIQNPSGLSSINLSTNYVAKDEL